VARPPGPFEDGAAVGAGVFVGSGLAAGVASFDEAVVEATAVELFLFRTNWTAKKPAAINTERPPASAQ
jgi:hypothetical protein